jgi:hypothetical protein
MRRTAPPSTPYGRYAVGLRPSLDPDAYFDAPNQDKEAPKQTKTTRRLVLTGPSPSGMTCEIMMRHVVRTIKPNRARRPASFRAIARAVSSQSGSWTQDGRHD